MTDGRKEGGKGREEGREGRRKGERREGRKNDYLHCSVNSLGNSD